MSLIDRYILRLFALYFFAGVVVFVTLYLTVDLMTFGMRHLGEVGSATLIKYYGYHIPWIVYQLTPVAALLATLFTLSSLNRTNELTALFSFGMSLRRVSMPIWIAVGLISAASFAMGDQILPRLLQKRNYVEYVEIKKRPGLYSTVKTNKIWFRTENILFNIKTLNPDTRRAQGITLYYFDPDWQLTQLIAANEVEMRGSLWNLKNGLVTLFAAESSFPLTRTFSEKTVTMNEDLRDIQSSVNSSATMSLRELGRFIDRNKEAGLDTLRYEVEYHSKFGFAFAALVMSMVGVPFTVSRSRSGGTFVNLGLCLALAFGYWVAYSSGLTLGEHGAIPPLAAAWGPNILGVGVSLLLLKRLKR
ncbi:MAG: LPS export ABC transporter permease LptG [Bdellovibrionales bacterium]